MTRFSARHAALLGVLLAIVLGPMWYGRLAPTHDECPGEGALLDARALDPRLQIISEGEKSTNLEMGRLLATLPDAGVSGALLTVSVQRIFGLPNRLLQPALVMPGRREPDDAAVKILSTPNGDLPIQYALERRGRSIRVTAYFLAYRREGIRSPFWTRLLNSPSSLLLGSWPITLVAISGRTHPGELEKNIGRMDAWLLGAWAHYQEVCAPTSAASTSANAPL